MSKIAYLIGNNEYDKWENLKNPINDLKAMENELYALGFKVKKYENLTRNKLNDISKEYHFDLFNIEQSIFYYSGHGIEVNGCLYLIPVDGNPIPSTKVVTTKDLYSYIDITSTINEFPKANNFINIFIFDCCREFCDLVRDHDVKDISKGIIKNERLFSSKQGTFISFSTSPNMNASDGKDNNGLFTKHLVNNIRTPGQTIEKLFKEIRVSVMEESDNRQIPWEHSSLVGEFHFMETNSKELIEEFDFNKTAIEIYNMGLSARDLRIKSNELYSQLKEKSIPIVNNMIINSEEKMMDLLIDELEILDAKKMGV
ncbi:caspase family protein [Paenibacillus xylanexedens]|uniref:caspase family protein n=1 Tax=Paenibacillus xylanexedens TaxID=528191 RepID=UPI003B01BAC4